MYCNCTIKAIYNPFVSRMKVSYIISLKEKIRDAYYFFRKKLKTITYVKIEGDKRMTVMLPDRIAITHDDRITNKINFIVREKVKERRNRTVIVSPVYTYWNS